MRFFVDEEVATDPGSAIRPDGGRPERAAVERSGEPSSSPGSIAKGSRLKTVNRGYEYDAVITTYERPARLGFEVTGRQLDISVSFRFEAAGPKRTRMHREFDIRPKGVMKLLFPKCDAFGWRVTGGSTYRRAL